MKRIRRYINPSSRNTKAILSQESTLRTLELEVQSTLRLNHLTTEWLLQISQDWHRKGPDTSLPSYDQ